MSEKIHVNNRTKFSGNGHPGYVGKIAKISCIITAVFIVLPFLASAATPTYTGCVNVTGTATMPRGMIYNIQMGNSPSAACKTGDFKANFSAGDVTGVIAGSGLAGGGQNGNVTLNVRTGGIVNGMLANNAVTSNKIANGSIIPEDLAFNPATQAELDAHNHDSMYAKSNQSCTVGKVVTGVNAAGDLICSDASSSSDLEVRLARLESILNGVNRSGNDIYFNGTNVHIIDGSGTTDGAVNGLGNLIIGYNELRGTGDNRTGSHNLVLGSKNNYASYGGLVAGTWNQILGQYASVSGGDYNTASGSYSSICGGSGNTASGYWSSVSGGRDNTASGEYSSVSGGGLNKASGYASSVSAGDSNTVSGWFASVSGGASNKANQLYASVSGGYDNIASGSYSSVSGGSGNKALSYDSSISGGRFNTVSEGYSSVSGGSNNTASGLYSSVSGGYARSVTSINDWRAGTYFSDS